MKPRFLRILRVEDEAVPLSSRLPLEDLGRIGVWQDFVRALSGGRLAVVGRDKGILEASPELVTVDFRFDHDRSLPPLRPTGVEGDPVLRMGWSQHLHAPNAGVVIGATLMGVVSQRDLPTLCLLHTLTADDTRKDVTTVLLVSQMLACNGKEFSSEKSVIDAGYEYLGVLEPNHESAVLSGIEEFRRRLAARLGVGDSAASPACLFVDPDSLGRLLSACDAADSDEDLDERFAQVGLEVWDRDGDGDCLDLRSVFLDRLTIRHRQRTWDMLPLGDAKERDGHAGPVLAWLSELNQEVGFTAYESAAQVVQANRDGTLARILDYKKPFVRLLGIVFAVLEEQIRLRRNFEMNLLKPWDAWADGPSDDSSAPPLGRQLRMLGFAMSEMTDSFRPELLPRDGSWPITHPRASICQGLQMVVAAGGCDHALHRILGYEDAEVRNLEALSEKSQNEADFVVLDDADDEVADKATPASNTKQDRTRRRVKIVKNLLEHMVFAGLVERVEKKEREGEEERNKVHFRLRPGPHRRLEGRAVTIDKRRVADLLGFDLTARAKSYYNQLDRIIEHVGYDEPSGFSSRLITGPVPAHIAQAARWYVEKYYPDLNEADWPAICTF